MNILRQTWLYLKYLIKAKTKYRLHSPFIFDLSRLVLDDDRFFYAYEEVENLKNHLEKDHRIIPTEDYGAGSNAQTGGHQLRGIVKQTSVSKKFGRLLFRLADFYQCRTIVELGTAAGISTAYLASASRKSKVISVEGNSALAKVARHNMKSLGQKNTTIISGTFEETLPEILKKIKKIDLLYLDGNHRKGPTLNYFEQCLSKLHSGSIVIVDDIYWSKGMMDAWKVIKNHPSVTVSVDLYRMGLLFFRKEQEKEHFLLLF